MKAEGELKIGAVKTELSLPKIINSDNMLKLRKSHISGKFPETCQYCSEYESKTSKKFQ